jgi:hypothetical protein
MVLGGSLLRKIKRNFYLVLMAIAMLSSSIYVISERSSAAALPTVSMTWPTSGASINAGSNNKASIQFKVRVADADTASGLKTQVLYMKTSDGDGRSVSDTWHNFGSLKTRDPYVSDTSTTLKTTPNNVSNQYVNSYGWSCWMSWATGPANCDTAYLGARPAHRNNDTYFPPINFDPGTYRVAAHGMQPSYSYGPWIGKSPYITFTVKKYVAPPPPPPPPSVTKTPAKKTPAKKTAPVVTTAPADTAVAIVEDKEPPTVPTDLLVEYSKEDSAVSLRWSPSSDNSRVEGYEIERLEKDQTEWEKISTSENPEYIDFNFEPQKTYSYRVRAYDPMKNYSEYSNLVEIAVGAFEPNVTVKDGGKVSDADNKVTAEFNPSAVAEDLFVSIEKTDFSEFSLEKNSKTVGNVYDVRAKNSKGDEITSFKSQLTLKFNYSKTDAKGANTGTIRMATVSDGKLDYLRTSLDPKTREVRTITDHLSIYMLVAEKSSPLLTFLRVLLWIFVIIGVAFGGYFGWTYYQKQKYQKEHRDDYIYKH